MGLHLSRPLATPKIVHQVAGVARDLVIAFRLKKKQIPPKKKQNHHQTRPIVPTTNHICAYSMEPEGLERAPRASKALERPLGS